MIEFSPLLLMQIICVNFLSAFLQASSGFGYAVLGMALMPFFLPLKICSAISAFTAMVIAVQMTALLRKSINFRVIAVPVTCCLLSINLGMYILLHTPEKTMRLILASLIILLAVFFVFTQKRQIIVQNTVRNGILFGLVAGIATGMFNIIGPFLSVYYFNTSKDNLSFKGNLELSFLLTTSYTTALHVFYGNLNASVLPFAFCSAAVAVAAGFIGLRLYKKINNKILKRIIYVFLPLVALILIKDILF